MTQYHLVKASDFVLGYHNAVRIAVDLADLDLNTVIFQRFEIVVAESGLGLLFLADCLPLVLSALLSGHIDYYRSRLTSSLTCFSS